MLRLGLCCKFEKESIKFYTTTATSIMKLGKKERLNKISNLCRENALSLQSSLEYCAENKIGSFRVNSQILPLKTHPEAGYEVKDLPEGNEIIKLFKECKGISKKYNLRTVFHPDQFIVLNSPKSDVVDRSIADLEYQAEVSHWIGADVMNIHGGGAYGDKKEALKRFIKNYKKLPKSIKKILTVENDDKIYTPADLLPICKELGLPLVYDVHHHRCNPDALSVEEATKKALRTWNREPLFHISSPKEGWKGPKPSRHHDYINIKDFPKEWLKLNITVEIEAKAKELAILKLRKQLL